MALVLAVLVPQYLKQQMTKTTWYCSAGEDPAAAALVCVWD